MNAALSHVSKRYPRGKTALDAIDLEFDTGMFGLLGPNGAGKSTLMRILATLLAPTAGTVQIGPWQLDRRRDRAAIRGVLGYLPQDLELYPELTAAEMVEYVALLKGVADHATRRQRRTHLLELVGLADVAGQQIKALSGGMRQRVGIAQALVNEPQLLIVDEPTAGLDPQERIRFRNLLADLAEDRTVLLSTHIVEDIAQSCHHLAVLDHGRIAFHGTVPDLINHARGHVWHTHTQPSADATIVATTPTAHGTSWRAIGTAPQDAEPADATLEDGYVALMRQSTTAPADH